MNIIETTPEPRFTIELTRRELLILKIGFGQTSEDARRKAGSPEREFSGEGYNLYETLCAALSDS